MAEEIVIKEKSEGITFEEIREVIVSAHQRNFEKGIIMQNAVLSAEDIAKTVGEDGKCFVALDGDKVVGTCSCRIGKLDRWYHKGDVLKTFLLGILPEYQGRHISSRFISEWDRQAKIGGVDVICFDTAEGNTNMIELSKRKGFIPVRFFSPHSDHYSVEMVKWLDGAPYSSTYLKIRFTIQKMYITARFKPGHIKRFGI